MTLLLLFAFISGLVTIFAPCIWPLLPIILSSGKGGKQKSLGITLGVIISFSIFTLTLSYLVSLLNFNPDILRLFAVVVLTFLGFSLLIPKLAAGYETVLSKLSGLLPGTATTNKGKSNFLSGLVTGLSLGIVWSPCAGPILATIAALGATRAVNFGIVLVTLSYVAGVGIVLFLFSYGGNLLLAKSRVLNRYTGTVQKIFGIIIILTALSIFTNYDKVLQAKLLDAIPSYSNFIYELEGNEKIAGELSKLKGQKEMPDKTGQAVDPVRNISNKAALPVIASAPEFTGIFKWLNSDPLTMAGLKGKVVLIDFWTYTCINCIRTLPHVTSWYEKYKDNNFVVIGVHTPEFEFEKSTANVEMAMKQYKINYPVAQDNDYATWDAYNNTYWPAKYLIDSRGNIRYTHFGEGKYEETEKNIRALIEESGFSPDKDMTQVQTETPSGGNQTPESYLGIARMDRFASDLPIKSGVSVYTAPKSLPTHFLAFEGNWFVADEYSRSEENSNLYLNFLAEKVFLVIHPAVGSTADQVRVFLDDQLILQSTAGSDVKNSIVTVTEPRLYNLVDFQGKKENHLLRLEFLSPGTSVFAFTFG